MLSILLFKVLWWNGRNQWAIQGRLLFLWGLLWRAFFELRLSMVAWLVPTIHLRAWKWQIGTLQLLWLLLTPFQNRLGSLVPQWLHHQCIRLLHLCTVDPSWRFFSLLLQMWRHSLVSGAWVVVVCMGKVMQVGPTIHSEWGHLLGRIRF